MSKATKLDCGPLPPRYKVRVAQVDDIDPIIEIRTQGYSVMSRASLLALRFRQYGDILDLIGRQQREL